jgi:hypothetical protein
MLIISLLNASFISLLYEFDKQFYTNSAILNDNLDTDLITFKAINNAYMKHIRQAYKDIINNVKLEEFELIKILNPF